MIANPTPLAPGIRTNMFGRTVRTVVADPRAARVLPMLRPRPSRHFPNVDAATAARMDRAEAQNAAEADAERAERFATAAR